MPNRVRHIILLFLGEGVPPIPEFIGELDFHATTYSMPYTEYCQLPGALGKRPVGVPPGACLSPSGACHRISPASVGNREPKTAPSQAGISGGPRIPDARQYAQLRRAGTRRQAGALHDIERGDPSTGVDVIADYGNQNIRPAQSQTPC